MVEMFLKLLKGQNVGKVPRLLIDLSKCAWIYSDKAVKIKSFNISNKNLPDLCLKMKVLRRVSLQVKLLLRQEDR